MISYATKKVMALLALAAGGYGIFAATVDAKLPPLKTGDIVFQHTESSASDAIMLASGTLYTHVGIVEIDKAGKPIVIEAVGPVRKIPLDAWTRKGIGERITIKRIKGLDEGSAEKALRRARYYMGRPYDHYFYESRDQIYCSELVHAAFKEGADIEIGREEKLGELNIDNAAARKLIQQRWKSHPMCKAKGARTFEACYALILDQTLVTPASIARDPQMQLIYTSFGASAE